MIEQVSIVVEGRTVTVSTEQEDDGSWVAWIPDDDSPCMGWGDDQFLAIIGLFDQTNPPEPK